MEDRNEYAEAVERLARRNGFSPDQTQALMKLAAAVSVAVRARLPLRILDDMVNVYACPKCEGRGVLGRNGGLGKCLPCDGKGWLPPRVVEIQTGDRSVVEVNARQATEPAARLQVIERKLKPEPESGAGLCGAAHPTKPGVRCTRVAGSCAAASEQYPRGFHEAFDMKSAAGDVVWPLDASGNPPEPDQDVVLCGFCGNPIPDVLAAQKVDAETGAYWVCGPGQCGPTIAAE